MVLILLYSPHVWFFDKLRTGYNKTDYGNRGGGDIPAIFQCCGAIETNGDLTIVRKGAKKYSVVIIDNGDVDADALVEIGRDEKWLMRELKKKKIKNMDEVLLAQWHNNRLQIIKKEGWGGINKWSAIIFFHVWEMRNKMPTIKYVDDTKHISEYYPAINIK